MEEDFLCLTFTIMKYCGLWKRRPDSHRTFYSFFYNVFTALVLAAIFSFSFGLFLDAILQVQGFEEFAASLFILFTIMSGCSKALNILLRDKDIREMVSALTSGFCEPRDEEERSIRRSFDRTGRAMTMSYLILVMTTVGLIILRPIFSENSQLLPYRMWFPYDHTSSRIVHSLLYIYQSIGGLLSGLIHVAMETLVAGFLHQIAGQLEIFQHRLHRIAERRVNSKIKRSSMFEGCIRQHVLIFKYAETLNHIFRATLLVQFAVTCVSLCTSIYLMATIDILSMHFAMVMFYTACMLSQLFLYCWYGNELIVKSQNVDQAVYEMDWLSLDVPGRKVIICIMIRSARPMKITAAFVLPLSVDTYMNMLKVSYSAFNFLQRSTE